MMARELGTPEESSTMQIIDNLLGSLEPEGFELTMVPLEAVEKWEQMMMRSSLERQRPQSR